MIYMSTIDPVHALHCMDLKSFCLVHRSCLIQMCLYSLKSFSALNAAMIA